MNPVGEARSCIEPVYDGGQRHLSTYIAEGCVCAVGSVAQPRAVHVVRLRREHVADDMMHACDMHGIPEMHAARYDVHEWARPLTDVVAVARELWGGFFTQPFWGRRGFARARNTSPLRREPLRAAFP
jgi:hypothetical protein